MRQRLRKSRTARQSQRATGASDGRTETRLDATRITAGHKTPRESQVSAIKPARVAEGLSHGASVRVVKRATHYYRADTLLSVDRAIALRHAAERILQAINREENE